METKRSFTAFAGERLLFNGSLSEVLSRVKERVDEGATEPLLVFEDESGRQIDFNLQGTKDEVLVREAPESVRAGPGRPKLGVVSREVSLLPRHWAWLEQQPQGLSGALRRLVEQAIKQDPGKERARLAREAAGKFMWAMGGDRPHFEEASRALYAGDDALLEELTGSWPGDIRGHVLTLLRAAAPPGSERGPGRGSGVADGRP